MLPDQFCNLTWREFMSWRLEDSNQSMRSIPSNGYRGYTQQESRLESNQNANQLLSFKKRDKREESQYTILKGRSILKLLKGTFWSQPQPMTVRGSWKSQIEVTRMFVSATDDFTSKFGILHIFW